MEGASGTVRRRRGEAATGAAVAASGAAAAATGAAAAAGPVQPPVGQALRDMLIRSVLLYGMYQMYWKPKRSTPDSDTVVTTGGPSTSSTSSAVPDYYNFKLTNEWPSDVPLECRLFSSLEDSMKIEEARNLQPAWTVTSVTASTDARNFIYENITLDVPDEVRQRNGSWYMHVFVTRGRAWNEDLPSPQLSQRYLYYRHELVTWKKTDVQKEGKNLLGNDQEEDEDGQKEMERSDDKDAGESLQRQIRYDHVWKPVLPVTVVTAVGPLQLRQLPVLAAEGFRVNKEKKTYYPPMMVNDFWTLQEKMHLMNESVDTIRVEMSFTPMSLIKWVFMKQFDGMWKQQISMGIMRDNEPEELKRMFIETNPVLLGTTMFVSLAHTVLETLAFKSDIAHWKNLKSLEGVSVRSMIWKIAMEIVIMMYLWDNETSWMIVIGNGFGIALSFWKLGKAVKVENLGKRKLLGFIPWFDIVDRESYSKETKEYDEQAMRYLGYALYPLVICYSLYSLKYEKHKSWYSWVINSLVGAVYAFGFIMMFPQIFINYKLKSVAHMPMKAMMYKTLNTIIDDLFSFIVKMPWLHRLACFRDDIVFLVLLYQRWIYPVDAKRVNEFGQRQEDEDGDETVVQTSDSNESEAKDAAEKKND